MRLTSLVAVIMAAGLALECLGAPVTFPERDEASRSISHHDYDDYDSRIHHHHQQQGHHQHHQHNHHGGFNKKKRFKKKKKKRPCYYRTVDGRTFFWTGLNIYETNIYVNHPGNLPQGDVGAAVPCSSAESDAASGPQYPEGSLQSPQRPNRPVLQTLASYIPSGPTAWNWAQGVPWSSYIPSHHSINSAVNNAINYLPGFGSSRPRPPSPPIRPTESPFTRPTDFTRPPTFTRPTQQPVYTRPTQPTVFTRPTQQPVFTRPTQQPVFVRPTQQPVFTRPTQQPVFTRPTSTSSPVQTSSEDGSDENYDYSNFSSENMDNSADTAFNGLGSAGNQPASNIPTVGSIGNGIKPVYERPSKYFNDYIVKPFRGSIREVVSWFR